MSTKINLTPFELLVVLAVPSTDGHNADNRLYYCTTRQYYNMTPLLRMIF